MALQLINIGTSPNDGTGDNLRDGGIKINANFQDATVIGQIYDKQVDLTGIGVGSILQYDGAKFIVGSKSTPGLWEDNGTILSPITDRNTAITGHTSDGTSRSFKVISGVSEVFSVVDNGNVGIGNENPVSLLEVGLDTAGESNYITIGKGFDTDSGIQFSRIGIIDTRIYSDQFENLVFETDITNTIPGGNFIFNSSGSELARITEAGLLGIGTAVPAYELDVNGDVRATDYYTSAFTSGSVLFSDGNKLASDNTSFFWDNTNKRLGIGTNTPNNTLRIESSEINAFFLRGSDSSNVVMQLRADNATANQTIRMGDNTGVQWTFGHEQSTGNFLFSAGSDITTERLVIQSTGEVGIGTDTPSDILQVVGAVVREGFLQLVADDNVCTGAEIEVGFNSQTRIDTDYYTHDTVTNNNQITIDEAGWYRISYNLAVNSSTLDRVNSRAWVEDDAVEIIPSKTYAYERLNSTANYASHSATFIAEIAASSIITLHFDIAVGTGVFGTASAGDVDIVANESWITIEKI